MATRYRISALSLLLLLPAAAASISDTEELTDLSARVGAARVAEHRLALENEQLRREVEGWMDVGTKVMKREAHIVNAIRRSRSEGAAPEGEAPSAAPPLALAERRQRAASPGSLSPTTLFACVMVGSILVAMVYCYSKGTDAMSKALMPALALVVVLVVALGVLTCFMKGVSLPPLFAWYAMGASLLAALLYCALKPEARKEAPALISNLLSAKKVLELSELQIEGLPAGFGEGYLLVQPSGGQERSRTRVEEQYEDGAVMRFGEVINLSIKNGDGPCVIAVYRRDGEMRDTRIGSAELLASELLGPAGVGGQAPRQYFRFKVRPESLTPVRELGIAMRIREVRAKGAGTPPKAHRAKHFNQMV